MKTQKSLILKAAFLLVLSQIASKSKSIQEASFMKDRRIEPSGLQESSVVNISLNWKKTSQNTTGFVLDGYALSSETKTQLVLSIEDSTSFLGAQKIQGKGSNDWGIPDCTASSGCTPVKSDIMVLIQGKNYPARSATVAFKFNKNTSPNNLSFYLLDQTPKASSPFASVESSPAGGLGIGPKSSFLRSWAESLSTNPKYARFSLTYKPDNLPIEKVLNASEDTFSGSSLTLDKKTTDLVDFYKLVDLKRRYGFKASFGLTDPRNTGTTACVYPEGEFYFATLVQDNAINLKRNIYYELCSNATKCSSSTDIENGPSMKISIMPQGPGVNIERILYINSTSYIKKSKDGIEALIEYQPDLFNYGAACEGADFALGRLFFYEFSVHYYQDLVEGGGYVNFERANFIAPEKNSHLLLWILLGGGFVLVVLIVVCAFVVRGKQGREIDERGVAKSSEDYFISGETAAMHSEGGI